MGGGGRNSGYNPVAPAVTDEGRSETNGSGRASGDDVADRMFDKYGIAATRQARNTTAGAFEDFAAGSSWVLDQFPTLSSDVDIYDYNPRSGSAAYASIVRTADGVPRVSLTMASIYAPIWYDSSSSDVSSKWNGGMADRPRTMSTGAHETAHALGQHLNNIEVRKMKGLENWQRYNEAVSAWNEGRAEQKIIERAYKKVGKKIGGTLDDARRTISNYAATNDSETFAEAFGEVFARGNNASIFARAIVDETVRTYKRMTK